MSDAPPDGTEGGGENHSYQLYQNGRSGDAPNRRPGGRRLNDSEEASTSLALSQVKEELVLYQKQSGSRELVELMLSALKEFKMCGIRPEDLKAAVGPPGGGKPKEKIRETGLRDGRP